MRRHSRVASSTPASSPRGLWKPPIQSWHLHLCRTRRDRATRDRGRRCALPPAPGGSAWAASGRCRAPAEYAWCAAAAAGTLRGRRMAVLFEEVVLGDEDVVIPELIGELDLLQRFVVYLEFVLSCHWSASSGLGVCSWKLMPNFMLSPPESAGQYEGAPGCPGMNMRHLYVQPGALSTRGEILGYSVGALLSGLWHNSVSIFSSPKLRLMSTRKLPSHDRYLQRHRKTRS